MLGMSMLMGARGIGALIGPLVSAPWAGHNQRRLRIAILVAFFAEITGYVALGWISSLWTACLWVMLAHCGGSVIWVFSTTLLQLNTDDVFAAASSPPTSASACSPSLWAAISADASWIGASPHAPSPALRAC